MSSMVKRTLVGQRAYAIGVAQKKPILNRTIDFEAKRMQL